MTNEQLAVILGSYEIGLYLELERLEALLIAAGLERHGEWHHIEDGEIYHGWGNAPPSDRLYEYEKRPTGSVVVLDGLREILGEISSAKRSLWGEAV